MGRRGRTLANRRMFRYPERNMLILQSPARANAILEAIMAATSPRTEEFNVAVAYVTYQGARTLLDGLAGAVEVRWASIPKCVVTCFDFGHTEPDALAYLEDAGFEVRIANLGAGGVIRLVPNPASFHPKIYIAPTGRGANVIIGSANLSRRALTVNTEAVTSMALDDEDAWRPSWKRLVDCSVRMSPQLLKAYRKMRPRQQKQRTHDEPPVPPPAPPNTLPLFRESVAREVDPATYKAFWVQVGMPSGGAGSQLEMPRLANRYFGFSHSKYDNEQRKIGDLTLIAGVREWTRTLAWHGDNRMERVNLPTANQGGFEYGGRVVLFERAGARFEFTVADTASRRAERWRNESAALGTLFRVGEMSPRLCGLI